MRQIRYGVAMSLDGYIADAKGGYDWIVTDPDIDFAAMFAKFDTLLMGRKTFELFLSMPEGAGDASDEMTKVVFSTTLKQKDHPKVRIVSDNWQDVVRELREKPGKDIWIFGGGEIFRLMLDAGFVDGLDVAVIPVLLGSGIPMLPPIAKRATLRLARHRVYEKTGTVKLEYDVVRASSRTGKGKRRSKRSRK